MKSLRYILIATIACTLFSCVKDPFSDLEDGSWNNERSIINIKFENQVGKPAIERIDESKGEIVLTINVSSLPDLSNIKLSSVQLSVGATSTLKVGESLNFENDTHSATVTITSPTGKSRTYTIVAESFEETILGTYSISNLIVYGGTGPEWGGGAVLAMTDKPWVWPADNGPQAELDNTLTLELTGISDKGNTFGTIVNDAGTDGLYADFQYVLDPPTDINHFYRTIPKGEGQWERDYASGTVIFTFADGSTSIGKFIENEVTEDLGDGNSKTTSPYAFSFDLNGTDDWDKIYSDYDKFVKKPRKYWVELTKN